MCIRDRSKAIRAQRFIFNMAFYFEVIVAVFVIMSIIITMLTLSLIHISGSVVFDLFFIH